MVGNVVQLVLNAIVNVFLNAILNIFEICSVLFGLFFLFYNAECLSVYNCILKVFSSDGFLLFIYIICCRSSRLSPRTCCVSCSSPTPFYSCFVQLALQAQTDTKHERQWAPHDGSLATVCGDSRGQRYGIENPKITYKKNCICEIIQNLKILNKLTILCK